MEGLKKNLSGASLYTDSVEVSHMSVLGIPLATFLAFVATVIAGSIGMLHYVVVHGLLDEPFPEVGDGGS